MSKRRFTSEQINSLLDNKYVAKCSDKSITYAKEFKLWAVKKYEEGMTGRSIFKEAGFDVELIGKNLPDDRLLSWRKKYKAKGDSGLTNDGRGGHKGGGRPKTKGLTDADKIKYLETEVAYLKAENDFLAKLRASKKR